VFPLQDGSVLQPTHEVLQWNDHAWVEDVKAWDEAPTPGDKDEEPAYVTPVSDVPDHKFVPPSAKSTPRAGAERKSALDRASIEAVPSETAPDTWVVNERVLFSHAQHPAHRSLLS
jgi:hypothetical protein